MAHFPCFEGDLVASTSELAGPTIAPVEASIAGKSVGSEVAGALLLKPSAGGDSAADGSELGAWKVQSGQHVGSDGIWHELFSGSGSAERSSGVVLPSPQVLPQASRSVGPADNQVMATGCAMMDGRGAKWANYQAHSTEWFLRLCLRVSRTGQDWRRHYLWSMSLRRVATELS